MSLGHDDLAGTVFPFISIDEFSPKSGTDEEVIVVAFYLKDDGPAKDLNTFIQRGSFDVLDSDVSPNPDEEGRHLVFVEFERNGLFRTVFPLFLDDIENLAGDMVWEIKPYLSDHAFGIDDPKLQTYIITEPVDYRTKDEFTMDTSIEESLKESCISSLTIEENRAIFSDGIYSIGGNVVDFGNLEEMSVKHRLKERAINFSPNTEIHKLGAMLGEGWEIFDLHDIVGIENSKGELLLLNNVQHVYNMKS